MGWIPETTVLTEMGDSGCRGESAGGALLGVIFLDPDATIGTKIATINFRIGEYFGCFHPNHGKRSILHLVPFRDFPLDFITYNYRLLQIQPHVPCKRNQLTKKHAKAVPFSFFLKFSLKRDGTPPAQPGE